MIIDCWIIINHSESFSKIFTISSLSKENLFELVAMSVLLLQFVFFSLKIGKAYNLFAHNLRIRLESDTSLYPRWGLGIPNPEVSTPGGKLSLPQYPRWSPGMVHSVLLFQKHRTGRFTYSSAKYTQAELILQDRALDKMLAEEKPYIASVCPTSLPHELLFSSHDFTAAHKLKQLHCWKTLTKTEFAKM